MVSTREREAVTRDSGEVVGGFVRAWTGLLGVVVSMDGMFFLLISFGVSMYGMFFSLNQLWDVVGHGHRTGACKVEYARSYVGSRKYWLGFAVRLMTVALPSIDDAEATSLTVEPVHGPLASSELKIENRATGTHCQFHWSNLRVYKVRSPRV